MHLEAVAVPDGGDGSEGYRLTMTDITARKEAEAALAKLTRSLERQAAQRTVELEEKSERLRKLVIELASAEDREQRRIGELLHDDLQQVLVGVKFHLEIASRQAVGTRQQDVIEKARRLLREAIDKSRSLSRTLSPPMLHREGLMAGIDWLARQMGRSHGLQVSVRGPEECSRLAEPTVLLLYKAVREMLLNVAKHAGTSEAQVEVHSEDDRLDVVVRDRGGGFDPARAVDAPDATGMGLLSIRERLEGIGGSLEVISGPGEGAWLRMRVPL